MPNYADPEQPWPEQDIIWRGYHKGIRNLEMHRQIAAGASHLVREVVLRHPDHPQPHNPQAIDTILDWAESEYCLLRTVGIAVPDVSWKIITDAYKRSRVLARVPVIRGVTLSQAPKIYEDTVTKLDAYDRLAGEARLQTLRDGEQFVYGTLATAHDAALTSETYLVDIDPM